LPFNDRLVKPYEEISIQPFSHFLLLVSRVVVILQQRVGEKYRQPLELVFKAVLQQRRERIFQPFNLRND
jgi:hypothetical protein